MIYPARIQLLRKEKFLFQGFLSINKSNVEDRVASVKIDLMDFGESAFTIAITRSHSWERVNISCHENIFAYAREIARVLHA